LPVDYRRADLLPDDASENGLASAPCCAAAWRAV